MISITTEKQQVLIFGSWKKQMFTIFALLNALMKKQILMLSAVKSQFINLSFQYQM